MLPKDQFITIPSVIFVFSFSFLLVLLAFLTETNYNLFIFLALTVVYLSVIFYLFSKKNLVLSSREVSVTIAGTVWLLILLALNTVSVSAPLSTLRWLQIAIGLFTFFIFFPEKLLKKPITELILFCSMLPSIVLFGWNLYFLVFNELIVNVPSKTLLTAVYGHNHVYIYYIYVIILSYYFIQKYQRHILLKAILITSFIGVCLSFSRVGMLLLFLVIGYRVVRKKSKPYALPLLVAVSMMYLSAVTALSLNSTMSKLDQCIFPVLKTQLCKSIVHEARDDYIRQALIAIRANPILGNGGGTFGIASLQYRDSVHGYSSMTHNEYLQFIYEYGVFGLLAVMAYLWAFIVATSQLKHLSQLGKHLWAIALMFTLDGFVNFNWNLSFIFVLHCMVLALLYREVFSTSLHKAFRVRHSMLYSVSLLFIATPVLLLTGRYAYAELFLKRLPTEYVKKFPYSEYQVKAALQDQNISEEDVAKLLHLYRKNSEIYLLASTKLNTEKITQHEYILSIDPYNEVQRVELLLMAAEQNRTDIVLRESKLLYSMYLKDNPARIAELKPDYLEQLLTHANQLSASDPQKAFELTLAAYSFEPWKINEVKSVFLEEPLRFPEKYINQLTRLPYAEPLWGYRESMSGWYIRRAKTAAEANNQEELRGYTAKAIELDTNNRWPLWDEVSEVYTKRIEKTYYQPSIASSDARRITVDLWRKYLEGLNATQALDSSEYLAWQEIIAGYTSP